MDSDRKMQQFFFLNATSQIRKKDHVQAYGLRPIKCNRPDQEKGPLKRSASIWSQIEKCNKPDQESESLKRGASIWTQTEKNATNQVRKKDQ